MCMKKINVLDSGNNKVQVFLVRFFRYNNNNYFIYTLQEQDVDGYEKLYLVKVMEEFGRYLSYHISDNEEWRRTQPILKTLLREIKYNKTRTFRDLDSNLLNNMRIEKTRVFKLDRNFVDILANGHVDLSQNPGGHNMENNLVYNNTEEPIIVQNHENNILEENNIVREQPRAQEIDRQISPDYYKAKYDLAAKEIDRLNEIMGELLAENIRYKSKYGDLD